LVDIRGSKPEGEFFEMNPRVSATSPDLARNNREPRKYKNEIENEIENVTAKLR
jgi:hypothetical protein